MAILMVAMLAFGGTYAYFTSSVTEGLGGTTYAGKISLSASGDAFSNTSLVNNVLPSEPLFNTGALEINDTLSNRASYVFISVTIKARKVWVAQTDEDGNTTNTETKDANSIFEKEFSYTDKLDLTDVDADITITSDKNTTGIEFVEVAEGVYGFLTTGAEYNADKDKAYAGDTFSVEGIAASIPSTWGNAYQGAEIVVTITVDSIQAYWFDDINTAYSTYGNLVDGVPQED